MAAPNIINVTEIIPHTKSITPADTSRAIFVDAPPLNTAYKINQITIANIDGTNAVNATVEMRLSDGASYRSIGSVISVPADTTLILIDKTISFYLLDSRVTGEPSTLWATSGTAGKLTFTVSYEAIVNPAYYSLYSWGRNNAGQLGLNDTTYRSSSTQIGTLTNWKSIEGGYHYSVCIKTDGTLWSWGRNDDGQLGLGNITNYSSPKQVGALTTWSSIAAGGGHTLAIKNDGTLWTWGWNSTGQLGLTTPGIRSSPTQIGSLTTWASVDCTHESSLAIKTDGTLWMWGQNGGGGQLGLGDSGVGTDRSSPTQVGTLTNWSSGRTGMYHTLAIKTDGTLWAWGMNGNGQLGLGDAVSRSSPVQVGALTTWSKVSGGMNHTLAIRADGTLWAWGRSNKGQLGLGNITTYSSPKQVGALSTWSDVRCGWDHTIACKSDGTVWSWGLNNYGQLGLGTSGVGTDQSSPVQVGNLTNWLSISSGFYHALAILAS